MLISIRDSFVLVDGKEWGLVALLLVVHITTALLETAGAGLIYVFFKVALEQDTFGGIPQIQSIYDDLGIADRSSFMALLTLVVLVAFLARTSFQTWSAWLNLAVVRRMHRRVASLLFNGYTRDSYVQHLKKSSALVMANVSSNASGAVAHCTIGLVEIASASILMMFFIATLFFVKPIETLVTCVVLGTMSGVYWWVMHERLTRWGERMVIAVQRVYRAVSEAFTGIKTIKVMGVEKRFEERFSSLIREQTTLTMKSSFAAQMPRLALEVVLVTGILGLVGGAFLLGRSSEELVPTLALFGIAALRIIPAFSRVMSALQLYKGAVPCLRAILPDYVRFSKTEDVPAYRQVFPKPKLKEELVLEKVSFAYDDSSAPAIRDISLSIKKGQFVGFAGRSGSGKTTTADIVLGLLQPATGRVLIDGAARTHSESGFHGLFAYVPQDPFIIDDSLLQNIVLGVKEEEIDRARVESAIRLSSLSPVVEKLPRGFDTVLGERGSRLSGGERQRLGLARALYCDADVLVLDEPTSALDAVTEGEVSAVIDALRGEKTIIMIAHRLSTIARCDQLFFFDGGRLVGSGDFEQLMASAAGFREMVEHLKIKTVTDPLADVVPV